MSMWFNKLDENYNFALGSVLASFSTTKQLEMMRKSKPPFLDDYSQQGEEQDCKGASCISGVDFS